MRTTFELADIVRSCYPNVRAQFVPVHVSNVPIWSHSLLRQGSKIDPATRTFQALRIAVNDEARDCIFLTLSLHDRHLFAALVSLVIYSFFLVSSHRSRQVGGLSVLFRQTNIVWLGSFALEALLRNVLRGGKLDLSRPLDLLRIAVPYGIPAAGFAVFLVVNGGIVLGSLDPTFVSSCSRREKQRRQG